METKKKWYDHKVLTHVLLFLFFPIGLYALWKTKTIASWWKITATLLIGSAIITNIGSNEGKPLTKGAVQKCSVELTPAEKDSIKVQMRLQEIETRKNTTISSYDLVTAYINNEVAADKNFKGKTFYVEGKIESIGKDILDEIYVTLKSRDLIRSVQCYIDDPDKVSRLRKGQSITIFGVCEGLMMNVLMQECQIVPNIEEL